MNDYSGNLPERSIEPPAPRWTAPTIEDDKYDDLWRGGGKWQLWTITNEEETDGESIQEGDEDSITAENGDRRS